MDKLMTVNQQKKLTLYVIDHKQASNKQTIDIPTLNTKKLDITNPRLYITNTKHD